jgi:methyl-accepting chemotaxis protein
MSPEDRIVPPSRSHLSSQDQDALPNIGNIVPDRDDASTYHRQKQSRAKAKEESDDDSGGRSGAGVLGYVLGALILALGGFAGFLYQQLTLAQERVGALEQRLSMTDESVNQSSVSMQVKLTELDAAFAQMRDETLKGLNGKLGQHGSQLESLEKASKNAQAALGKLGQRGDQQDKALADTRAQVEKIPPTVEQAKRKLDEHDAALAAVNGKVKATADVQAKHEGRLNNNDEWVESINTFRKQMNREIVNIKQQVAGGKPPAPNDAPLP